MRSSVFKLFPVLALVASSVAVAAGESYPDRPVTLVVPFAAGSGTDAIARVVAERLGERLGQPVIINNRAGANGQIGVEYAAKLEPDGYSLLMATSTTHSINPGMYKALRYDPLEDFTPIARTGILPFSLVVRPDLPISSVGELIDYAKQNPGKLSYAASNSTALLASEALRLRAGIDILEVQYKSAPQAMTDMLGGHIDMNVVDFAVGLPFIQSEQVRVLGVTMAERSKTQPHIPPIADTLPGFDLSPWNGIFGPKGMPEAIARKVAEEVAIVLAEPDTQERLADLGFEVNASGSPEEFGQYVEEQLQVWGDFITQAGIEPQ